MKLYKSTLFFVLTVLYRISLDCIYQYVLSANANFSQYYHTYAPSMGSMLLSYAALLAFTVVIARLTVNGRPSACFMILLFLLSYVPNNALYACMNLEPRFFLLLNVYWLFLLSFYYLSNRVRQGAVFAAVKNSAMRRKSRLLKAFPFVLLVCIAAFAYRYFGGSLSLTLDLKASNDLRMAIRGAADDQWMITRVLPWAATIVFPVAIVNCEERKRFIYAIAFSVGVAICYSVTGMKQWLFVYIITISVILYSHIRRGDSYYRVFPLALFGMNLAGLALYRLFGERQFVNYTTRRVLFAPAFNNLYHINYFWGKPKVYLTQSLFGWIRKFGVAIPYKKDISFVIGKMYYSADTAAPTGTFADAFENFGPFGLILYPFILIVSLYIFDEVARNVKTKYYISTIFIYAYCVLSGGLTNAIISYGFLFAIVYFYMLRRHSGFDLLERR